MIYETQFKLDYPVLDFEEAQNYLTEDGMTKYLLSDTYHIKNESDLEFLKNEAKIDIKWILKDEQSGVIRLTSEKEISNEVLEQISEWISGQNSDGLGEGFEQQDFACYDRAKEIDGLDEWDDEYEEDYVMASFDWRTNDYKLEKVEK